MSVIIALAALALLMLAAYRGYSVILRPHRRHGRGAASPTRPPWRRPHRHLHGEDGRLTAVLPVFLLGAVFGKLIEMSGFAFHRRRGDPACSAPARPCW